jgi:hypothetical protein
MCGRYLLHADPKLIERAFGAEFSQIPRELRIMRQGERELVTVR